MQLTTLRLGTPRSKERRHSSRLKVQSLVYLTVAPNNGGIVVDLNENGMGISMANPLGTGTQCRFSIALRDKSPVRGAGRITWLSESRKSAGIYFTELSADGRRQIREWLQPQKEGLVTTERGDAPELTNKETAPNMQPEVTPNGFPTGDAGHATGEPQTPLFFLPQTRPDDFPPANSLSLDESTQPVEDPPNSLDAVRSVLTQNGEQIKKETTRTWLFAIEVLGAAALALAIGFLLIFKGGDTFQYLKSQAAGMAMFQTTAKPDLSLAKTSAKVSRKHSAPASRAVTKEPVATTPVLAEPDSAAVPLHFEVTDSFNRHWLISASGDERIPANYVGTMDENPARPSPVGTPATSGGAVAPSTSTAPSTDSVESGADHVSSAGTGASGEAPAESVAVSAPAGDVNHLSSFTVVLDAVIGKNGTVKDVHVVSSPSAGLASTVMAAVRNWHYPPFYKNGEPAELTTRITVDFKPTPQKQ